MLVELVPIDPTCRFATRFVRIAATTAMLEHAHFRRTWRNPLESVMNWAVWKSWDSSRDRQFVTADVQGDAAT